MMQSTLGEEEARRRSQRIQALLDEAARVIVGQRRVLEGLVAGLLCEGHVLLEGVPGLGKSLMVRTLARTLDLSFNRIQFTPDLLPADLTGTQVFHPGKGTFSVKQGPLFAQVVLADEINRAPPKVQSALLEAMQERQVTLGDRTLPLPDPFLVLATQNPIEHEGTYPLPEAQVDRFLLKLRVEYPDREDELDIVNRMARTGADLSVEPVLDAAEVRVLREGINGIYADEKIRSYAVDLVRATRDPAAAGVPELEGMIRYGASPRAAIALVLTARAAALMDGRTFVLPKDVKGMAPHVLRHRVLPSFEAEAEGIDAEEIVGKVLEAVEVP